MEKCKFCVEESDDGYDAPHADECYRHCQPASDGKHVPDPKSITVPDGASDFIVDVNCKGCGQSGGVAIDPDAIDWG